MALAMCVGLEVRQLCNTVSYEIGRRSWVGPFMTTDNISTGCFLRAVKLRRHSAMRFTSNPFEASLRHLADPGLLRASVSNCRPGPEITNYHSRGHVVSPVQRHIFQRFVRPRSARIARPSSTGVANRSTMSVTVPTGVNSTRSPGLRSNAMLLRAASSNPSPQSAEGA